MICQSFGSRARLSEIAIISTMANLATGYKKQGQLDLALKMQRESYIRQKNSFGETAQTFGIAANIVISLVEQDQYDEAVTLAREQHSAARRALGPNHVASLSVAHTFALALSREIAGLREAESVMVDALPRFRRVLGAGHPSTRKAQRMLENLQSRLRRVTV